MRVRLGTRCHIESKHMSNSDKEHFLAYRDQTRIKHQILSEYLPPFFNILKKGYSKLVYIDGFAGAGKYTNQETQEEFDGSPLQALNVIAASHELSNAVTSVLVEPRSDHFSTNPKIKRPILLKSTFQDTVESIKSYLEENNYNLAPTFLFVDPCGVGGVHFESISDILKRPACEAFIFFNIMGVQRIAGLDPEKMGQTLPELFGSDDRVAPLLKELAGCSSSKEKEAIVVDYYCKLLREECASTYVLPFRVESEYKRSTSHYFIHATKHPIGFKIMREIMWKAGKLDGTDEGRLELLQSSASDISSLMRLDLEQADEAILNHLSTNGVTEVSVFRKAWPVRPDDRFTDACYRRRLLKLEADGKIIVLDKDRKTPKPAGSRPKRLGTPTLSESLYVRLV